MSGSCGCPCACHQHRYCSNCGCRLPTPADLHQGTVTGEPQPPERACTTHPGGGGGDTPPEQHAAQPKAAPSESAKKPGKRKTRNPEATLERYLDRIQQEIPAKQIVEELGGSYLSDFRLHEIDVEQNPLAHHASVLTALVKSAGSEVLGYTSENKKKGTYVHNFQAVFGKPREEAKIVYIGTKNRFTGHEESKWALKRTDEVWVSTKN